MLRLCLITLTLFTACYAGTTEPKCYKVENLTLETKVSPIRDWLVSYGAKVQVSAKILFKLYIPPQISESAAEQIVKRLTSMDGFSGAKVVRKGWLHKGVDLGEFTKPALEPLVASLLELGYAPGLKPVYSANQKPVMHVLAGTTPLNMKAFENTFPGHSLTSLVKCYLL